MSFQDIRETLNSAGISTSSLDRIRLARGVVGKASYVAGAAVLGLAVVAFVLRDPLYLLLDAILIVGLFIVYFAGVLWFAHKHPGEALLEGAELIQWRQLDMATKESPAPPQIPNAIPPPVIEGGRS